MTSTIRTFVAVGVGLSFLQACTSEAPSTDSMANGGGMSGNMALAAPTVAPATSINAVMVGLVDHAAHHIWDIGRDGMAPVSDRDWDEVSHAAIQLIVAGTYVTVGGTGSQDFNWVHQEGWRGYAQQVSDAGVAALSAAEARNLDAVLSAGDDLIMACEGCHAAFKPALPTEGIVHPHYDN